jgi:outer membrane protein TolC
VGAGINLHTNVPAGMSHTLDTLVAEALEKNPELKFYDAEITAAKAGRKTAGLLANPELSGGVGQKRVTGGGLSAEGVAWSVSVVQPFEWPGASDCARPSPITTSNSRTRLRAIQDRARGARADTRLRAVRRAGKIRRGD